MVDITLAVKNMDLHEFIVQFQDHLAPKLDTYEQAIYLYVFRHGRLLDLEEVTIGFKSARHRLATGSGENGKPMSEKTAKLNKNTCCPTKRRCFMRMLDSSLR